MKTILITLLLLLQSNIVLGYEETMDVHYVPIQVILVSAEGEDAYTTSLSREDIPMIFEKVNIIWAQAKIQFMPVVIQHNKITANPDLVEAYKTKAKSDLSRRSEHRVVRSSCMQGLNKLKIITLCVVGTMPDRPEGIATISRRKNIKPVVIWPEKQRNGLIANPATLAHELGHTLGLKHNGLNVKHLMASGSNIPGRDNLSEVLLSTNEITTARTFAIEYRQIWSLISEKLYGQ